MTPKEKAEELIAKFNKHEFIEVDSKQGDFERQLSLSESRHCALIAVNEIINLPEIVECDAYIEHQIESYWKEVLTELEQL